MTAPPHHFMQNLNNPQQTGMRSSFGPSPMQTQMAPGGMQNSMPSQIPIPNPMGSPMVPQMANPMNGAMGNQMNLNINGSSPMLSQMNQHYNMNSPMNSGQMTPHQAPAQMPMQQRPMEPGCSNNKLNSENENSFSDEYYEDELENPWKEFNEWKQKQIETSEKVVLDCTEEQYKSSEDFIDSSTSWIPDKENVSNSTSECSSGISQEIPTQELLQYQEKKCTQDNINNVQNSSITLVHEEQTPVSIIEEHHQDRPKLKILQNIIVSDITSLTPTEEKKETPKPERKRIIIENVGLIGDSKKLVDVSQRKSRIWDKKDRCVYCDRDCTNFSRHLLRNHENEDSVKKIIQLPKGDKERRKMIDILRKEGNLTLLDENKIRPVQRATRKYEEGKENSEGAIEFMPCPHCKGIYRLKSLRKHSITCSCNPRKGEKCNVASLGQNLLVFKASRRSFLDRLRLKNEVFPKMHADRASFNGKNDPVICQYAEDYLRKHKRPHITYAVSNKIRELGRLLIPLQDIYGINTLLEVMNTKHYDKVVHAAQIISGYDVTLKTFQSPSLAMHLRTILLFACLAAKTLLLKEDPVLPVTDYNEALKNIKKFRLLVDERWKFDMSSLALKDLNEKHGKKKHSLPITSDVMKFREYVVNVAEQSINVLKENINDKISFKKLTEAVLVLTVLLNRKRIGDVQYIKLDSYKDSTTSINQEECINVLSETEKLLSAHFKRIITIGKGSKSIPILFPKNVQTYIEVLLSSREKNHLVPKENPFLFALIGSKDKWMDGSSILRKYAALCGAENPKTLTSSRLRKQIATVLQVINLNETEKEQVASFMGHTKKTHEEFYRLPQEVYQTAKIAKLLLMMDKGEGADFQGKTLEEIDIHLDSLEEEDCAEIESDIESDKVEKSQTAKYLENEDHHSSLKTKDNHSSSESNEEFAPTLNHHEMPQQSPGVAPTPPVPVQQQQQQQSKEFNPASLCRLGQETVQDIVSRTQEVFQTLKQIQPPNGTPQSHNASNEKKAKVQELLRTIRVLFKRLRLVYERCNDNCQLQGMEYTHIESLIPFKDEIDPKHDEKKNSEAYRLACEESKEVMEQVVLKNKQLKEVIDHLRRIIWEINTMLTMRKS